MDVYLIRVGRRRINLEFLIVDEEGDGSPEIPVGAIRVTLQRGKEFLIDGDDAVRYRRQVEPLVLPEPADEPAPGGGTPAKDAAGGRRVGRSAKRPLPPRPAEGGREHGP